MCFRRTPDDLPEEDIILAALWHLHKRAVELGLPASSTFRQRVLGQRAGLRATDFRASLDLLIADGFVHKGPDWRLCLTPQGYEACREIIDVERALRIAA